MARLNINIGTTANDRTGDPLRTAFEKVNANFIELYTRTGDDLQIPALSGNTSKYLTTNGTTLSWGTISTTVDQLVNGTHTVVLGSTGVLTLPGTGTITNLTSIGAPTGTIYTFVNDGAATPGISSDNAVYLPSNVNSVSIQPGWIITFADSTQKTVLESSAGTGPNISKQILTFSGSVLKTGSEVWPLTVQSADYALGTTTKSLELTPDGTTAWTFSSDGTLSSPSGSLQKNAGPVNCQGNASTVVYTVSGQYQHTIKLLIQVEGIEGLGSILDTQACEMIIAKSFRADDIAASVYGIVYTSVAPLATFTALWNALTNRIEVLCTTPGANGVNVKIFATEISTSD